MKKERISKVMGGLSCDLVDQCFTYESKNVEKSKKKAFVKWGTLVASFVLVTALAVGIIVNNPFNPKLVVSPPNDELGKGDTVVGGISRRYNDLFYKKQENNYVYKWEEKFIDEKYFQATLLDKKYSCVSKIEDNRLIGEFLGVSTNVGRDEYTSTAYTQNFDAYSINGVSTDCLVAIKMENEFYAFRRSEKVDFQTFGDFFDVVDLQNNFKFDYYSLETNGETAYYNLTDENQIWLQLIDCKTAPIEENYVKNGDASVLSFTASSTTLCVFKRNFTITSDGYIKTNVLDFGYTFNIGQEKATQIIELIQSVSQATEYRPYSYSLIGTITEITDDYFLVSDEIRCVDSSDAITFKVLVNDKKIARTVKKRCVGEVVIVSFKNDVDSLNEYQISGVLDVNVAVLFNGDYVVLE